MDVTNSAEAPAAVPYVPGDTPPAGVVVQEAPLPDPFIGEPVIGAAVRGVEVSGVDAPHSHAIAAPLSHSHGVVLAGDEPMNNPLSGQVGVLLATGEPATLDAAFARLARLEARLRDVERAAGIAPVAAAEG